MRNTKVSIAAKLLITSMFFAGLFSSCEKGDFDTIQPAEKDADRTSFKQAGGDTANTNEHLGKQHIYALDELSEHSDFPLSISGNETYTVIKDYLKDSLQGDHFLNYEETKDVYNDFVGDTAEKKADYVQLSPAYFSGHLKGQASLSLEAVSYVNELEEAYENFQSVSELVGDIETIEADLAAETDLDSEEYEMLSGLLVIARNSVTYWDSVIQSSSHNWYSAFMEDLDGGEEVSLMLNLSLGSACTYGLVFTQENAEGYGISAAHSAGMNQASFHPGPGTIVDIEL